MFGRKTLLLGCMLALNPIAFAVTTNSNLISLPTLNPGFEVNVSAVWLKPGASNLNYVIFNKELPSLSPTWVEREIKPGFHAGFVIGARYVFPDAPSQDAKIAWTHLSTSDSGTTVAPDASFFLGPDFEIGPDGIPIRNASGKAKFNYNVLNLDVGQYVSFGQRLNTRFFAGLSGVSLQEKVDSVYNGISVVVPATGFTVAQYLNSLFTGAGPRFGASFEYDPCLYGFGITGEAAASVLIGRMATKTDYLSTSALIVDNEQFIKDQSVYQVIPGFDAKLGVNYKYWVMNNMMLTVSAGYQAAVYVNAISQYLPGSLVTPMDSGGIYVATMNHQLSNYSVQGPYLDFALKF